MTGAPPPTVWQPVGKVLTEASLAEDPPRAEVEPMVEEEEEATTAEEEESRRSRATRGTKEFVQPSKAAALSLRGGDFGDIITIYSSPNYNSKQMHGEVTKVMQSVDVTEDGKARCHPHTSL